MACDSLILKRNSSENGVKKTEIFGNPTTLFFLSRRQSKSQIFNEKFQSTQQKYQTTQPD